MDETVAEQVEIAAKYAGYIERQQDEAERHAANETPPAGGYRLRPGARPSKEVQIKLVAQRPETLARLAVSPVSRLAAISLLLVHLKRATGGVRSEFQMVVASMQRSEIEAFFCRAS